MDVQTLIKMVEQLPKQASMAIDVATLAERYYAAHPSAKPIQRRSRQTNMRRHLRDMREAGLVKVAPGPVERYHLVEGSVPRYFMNSEVALSLLWSRRILAPLNSARARSTDQDLTAHARLTDQDKVLRDRVRIVPDGVGRADAPVSPESLCTAMDALVSGHLLRIRYLNRQRELREHTLSVHGLVAKDGTLYLIATRRMSDPPIHFAMHRIQASDVLKQRADLRPDFDIDDYLRSQHQLSHRSDPHEAPIRLELRVHDKALFHFIERPLIGQDPIEPSTAAASGWHRVTATLPATEQLIHFLWSHAGWVEVVGPASVRDPVAAGVRAAAALYGNR